MLYRHEVPVAIGHLRQAVACLGNQGDIYLLARTRMNLARTATEACDLDLADSMLYGLSEEVERIEFRLLAPAVHFVRGRVAAERGYHEEACREFEIGRQFFIRAGNRYQVAERENCIGYSRLELGEVTEAGRYFTSAATHWNEVDAPVAAAIALAGIATVLLRIGEHARAERLYRVVQHTLAQSEARIVPFQQRFLDRLAREMAHVDGPPDLSLSEAVNLARSLHATHAASLDAESLAATR